MDEGGGGMVGGGGGGGTRLSKKTLTLIHPCWMSFSSEAHTHKK